MLYNRAEFEFGDRQLGVIIDDGRLRIGFTVPYHEISRTRTPKSFPEKAVSRFCITIIAATATAYFLTGMSPEGGAYWLCVGFLMLACVLAVVKGSTKFEATAIPVASGHNILVFHDGQQSVIIGEINKRRKAEILRLYGEVDTLNHPELELKKFTWLREEEFISEQELAEARLKIAAASKAPSSHH